MTLSTIRNVVLVAAVAALGVGSAGCYADAEVPWYNEGAEPEVVQAQDPALEGVDASVGYEPQYYGDYVVYYDTVGRPFYYDGGMSYYIPYTSPYYTGYVRHYQAWAPAYRHWYARGGYRSFYRGYGGVRGYHRGGFRGYHGGLHGGYHGGGFHGGFHGGGFHGGGHR